MKRLLICLLLVGVVGCGKSLQAQPKSKETKKAKTSPPKAAVNPWDTPTRLALFMAQKIENPSSKTIALSDIASTLAKTGEIKQAWEVTQKIEDPSSKGFALRSIALALAKAGEIKQALEVAQKIEEPRMKVDALEDIAAALLKAGDKPQALATLKQALGVAQKIEDPKSKLYALRAIAMTLATRGLRVSSPRMKKSFTPAEKQLARYLVELVQEK